MRNLRRRDDGRLYWHWDPRLINRPGGVNAALQIQDLKHAASRVRIPTLLMRGMMSTVVTDEGVAVLRRRISNVEVLDVANAGHMVAADKNDIFNLGLLNFLQR